MLVDGDCVFGITIIDVDIEWHRHKNRRHDTSTDYDNRINNSDKMICGCQLLDHHFFL